MAELEAGRDEALADAVDARAFLSTAQQRALEALSQAEQARLAVAELSASQAQAQAQAAAAAEAQARAQAARDVATSDLREQMFRTAEVLAAQERRGAESLAAALMAADRRANRERRSALREVRDAHTQELGRLQAELSAARGSDLA